MQMETSMKESGSTTKLMAKVLTLIQMEHIIKENGWMISNMELVMKVGLMEQNMRESTLKERSMEKES
jgi:hypothetical protein